MSIAPFIADLLDLAPSSVVFAAETGVDVHNQSTLGPAVVYPCYIAGPVRFQHRLSAQERVSAQTVYVMAPDQLSARAQITLPAGYDGTLVPNILQIDRVSDEAGFLYSIIYLG